MMNVPTKFGVNIVWRNVQNYSTNWARRFRNHAANVQKFMMAKESYNEYTCKVWDQSPDVFQKFMETTQQIRGKETVEIQRNGANNELSLVRTRNNMTGNMRELLKEQAVMKLWEYGGAWTKFNSLWPWGLVKWAIFTPFWHH